MHCADRSRSSRHSSSSRQSRRRVSAGKATKEADHFVGINCDGIAPASGTGFLFLGVSISDTFGPGGGLEMWNSSSPDGPPDITSDFEAPVDASYVGGVFTASFPLLDSSGDPAGTGTSRRR